MGQDNGMDVSPSWGELQTQLIKKQADNRELKDMVNELSNHIHRLQNINTDLSTRACIFESRYIQLLEGMFEITKLDDPVAAQKANGYIISTRITIKDRRAFTYFQDTDYRD